jgi:hypothetical protein
VEKVGQAKLKNKTKDRKNRSNWYETNKKILKYTGWLK